MNKKLAKELKRKRKQRAKRDKRLGDTYSEYSSFNPSINEWETWQVVKDSKGDVHFIGPKRICITCGKKRFEEREPAELFRTFHRIKYNDVGFNIYWSKKCGCYHLTSIKD